MAQEYPTDKPWAIPYEHNFRTFSLTGDLMRSKCLPSCFPFKPDSWQCCSGFDAFQVFIFHLKVFLLLTYVAERLMVCWGDPVLCLGRSPVVSKNAAQTGIDSTITMSPETTCTVDFKVGSKVYKTWYKVLGDLNCGKVPLVTLHGGPGFTHE